MNAASPLRFVPSKDDSISNIADADWRAPHVFTSRGYLAVVEECLGSAVRFDYALWRPENNVAGGAVFQTFSLRVPEHLPVLAPGFEGAAGLERAWRPWVAALLRRLRIRVVLCGGFFSCGPRGTWCDDGQDKAAFGRWLAATARKVARDASEPGVRVLVILKDFGASAADAPDATFEAIGGDPAMALELSPDWKSLDDYASTLKSSYRRELERTRERGVDVERRPMTAAQIRALDRRIDALHGQVLARARVVPARKNARFFARLAETLGPAFSFIGYYHRDNLVGFNTRFLCGEEFESHYFGVDRAIAPTLGLYKNMLYDDTADAMALGCRRVVFGRDAQEVKSGLGAQPMPYMSFLYQESRTLTGLLAATARRLGPASWVVRHPFR